MVRMSMRRRWSRKIICCKRDLWKARRWQARTDLFETQAFLMSTPGQSGVERIELVGSAGRRAAPDIRGATSREDRITQSGAAGDCADFANQFVRALAPA